MRLQFCGHSCFLIQAHGLRILVDPFIRPNAAATAIDADSLTPTHILLTHGHEDHVADAESIAKASGAELIAPYETAMWFSAKGVEAIRAINPGATFSLEGAEGAVHIRTVGAVHSSTLPDGSPGGVACGYLRSDGAHSVSHAGDTALSVEFDLIGRMWTPDVALLPIGGAFTMGYADLPAAMDMLNCRQVVGMHYDTFPPIEIDREEAIRTAEDAGGQLHLPDVGDTLDIPF